MPKIKSRMLALTAVAVGTVALAAGSSVSALAASSGDNGTATVTEPSSLVVSLAKAGIVQLPGGPDSSTYAGGQEVTTIRVVGGAGNVNILHGTLLMGGNLTWIDGATHRSAVLRKLSFNYDSGNITGWTGSPARQVTLATVGGDFTGSVVPNPANPAQDLETFGASEVLIAPTGAKFLNSALKTSFFTANSDIGSFGANYTFNIPS
jgi:hypothetical protein